MAQQICEVTIEPGRSFRVVVDDAMTDLCADALRQGLFWNTQEWDLISRFIPSSGGRFLDLGAHLGSFTLTAAACGHDVLAVDASQVNTSLLRASVELNRFRSVTVVRAAIYKESATLRFFDNGPYGFVVDQNDDRLPEVPALPMHEILDRAGWEHVDAIKMDIEGSEIWAIEGMERLLLRNDAPVIFYECNGRTLNDFGHSNCHNLRSRLNEFGYSSFVYTDAHTPLRPSRADELQPEVSINYLAVKLDAFPIKPASVWTRTVKNALRRRRRQKPINGWLRGWPVCMPATADEQIADFRHAIKEALREANPIEPMIAHQQLLRELAQAPHWLRSDPIVHDYIAQQSAEKVAA